MCSPVLVFHASPAVAVVMTGGGPVVPPSALLGHCEAAALSAAADLCPATGMSSGPPRGPRGGDEQHAARITVGV